MRLRHQGVAQKGFFHAEDVRIAGQHDGVHGQAVRHQSDLAAGERQLVHVFFLQQGLNDADARLT